MSDENDDEDKFVVVTTTYPTSYGCYRGRSWSRAELIRHSEVEISEESYNTHEEAADAALNARNQNYLFDDYEDIVGNDDPPFDSAEMENYDNDEEVIIQVMTKHAIDEKKQQDKEFLDRANSERHMDALIKEHLFRIRIQDAGRVHYSNPPRPYDIPAEIEIIESNNGENASVPENAALVKSIMYRGKHPSFQQFLQNPDENHLLFQLLRACTSLEELYLRSDGFQDTITLELLTLIQKHAPHVTKSIKVLSLAMLQVDPDALQGLEAFQNLERLDLTNCFSTEHWEEQYDSDGSIMDSRLPYDVPMGECLEALPNLRRLDIGNGDPEMERYMHDYSLSREGLELLCLIMEEKTHVGRITRDESNEPDDFVTPERAEAARARVLVLIWHQDDLPTPVRKMAETSLKTCCCNKIATKRCSKCQRKWYCSVDCQKNDFASHKTVCKETFEKF